MPANKLSILMEIQNADGSVVDLNKVAGATDRVGRTSKVAGKKVSNFGKQGLIAGASMKNLAGSIAIVQGPLGPVSGRISALGAVMGRLNVGALAATAGVTALGAALGKTISVTKDYESQMGKLNAIIKATGGTAQLSAAQIDQFAIKLGLDTLASAKGVRDAASALLSFRSISGDTFKQTLSLAQDLAATFGGNLRDKTLQLAKALEDPKTGLDALRRSGVMFTPVQKEIIALMVEMGDKAGAQKLILEEVSKEVGGAGVGAAKGLAGAFDTLSEATTNLFVRMGEAEGGFLPLQEVLNVTSTRLNEIAQQTNSINLSGATTGWQDFVAVVLTSVDIIGSGLNVAVDTFEIFGISITNTLKAAGQAMTGNLAGAEKTLKKSATIQKALLADIKANLTDPMVIFHNLDVLLGIRETKLAGLKPPPLGKGGIPTKTQKTTPLAAVTESADKAVSRENDKLKRLFAAHDKFNSELQSKADAAFGSIDDKEQAALDRSIGRLKARRDKELATLSAISSAKVAALTKGETDERKSLDKFLAKNNKIIELSSTTAEERTTLQKLVQEKTAESEAKIAELHAQAQPEIIANETATAEARKTINEDYAVAKENTELLSAEKTLARIKIEEEVKNAAAARDKERNDSILQSSQSHLDALTLQAKTFGLNAVDAEQARSDASEDAATNNFLTKFERLKGDKEAEKELVAQFIAETEAMEKIHGKRMALLKRTELQTNLNTVGKVMDNIATLMQSKNRTAFEIGKVAAIAGAVVNTLSGMVAALAPPPIGVGPVLGPILAGSIAVAGAMNIAKISSTQMGGGGSVSAGGASFSTPGSGGRQPGPPPGFDPTFKQKPTTPSISIVQHITAPGAQIGAADAIQAAASLGAQQALQAIGHDFANNGALRQQLAV